LVSESQIWRALQEVTDPEFPLSIVDLGMVYGVGLADGRVHVKMTFTAIGCPAIDMIIDDVKAALDEVEGVTDVAVEVVWSPPWTKDKISSKGREVLQYYGVGV
jgi:phenylacetate-CoA oxygenase PaaJ subunit